jgi:hypothetical protein
MVWFDGGEVCEGGVWLMRRGGGGKKVRSEEGTRVELWVVCGLG